MQHFELIEIINQTMPHVICTEAILIISSSQTSVQGTYAHLLQKIQQSNLDHNENIGFYVIRKLKSILLHTPKQIKQYTSEITNILQYLAKNAMIQKLTIISFEEGSLLTLRALSTMDISTFSMVNKVVLINAFSPFLMIYHGNSHSFLEDIKTQILRDPIRTKHINNTRIIIIDTFQKNLGTSQLNLLFKNQNNEDVTFANTLTISTRFMWNVYCYLKPQQYFKFEPFLWIITKMFNEDRQSYEQPLNIKQIEYLLHYRQLPAKKQMTIQTRSKLARKCFTFYFQQYQLFGDNFKEECVRLIRKTDIYFNENTTLIIKSQGKIQIYSQNLERLMPMDTKGQQTIYLFEKVNQYRKLHIINRRRKLISVQISGVHRPTETIHDKFIHTHSLSELKSFQKRKDSRFGFGTLSSPQPVLVCPGLTLLYPHHFFTNYKLPSPASSFNIQSIQGSCYEGQDYFSQWIQMLAQFWDLGCNMIVFTLFCSHIQKKQVFSRFYYQLIVNSCLTYIHSGQLLFTQNILLLGIVIFIQQILTLMVLMSDFINMPRKLSSKIMWPPLVFQLLKYYDPQAFPSPWKVLGLQFLAATHKQNVTILFLQFIYIIQYIALDLPNHFHLALICLWLSVSGGQEVESNNNTHHDLIIIRTGKKIRSLKLMLIKLRKQLANTVTLCIIAMCLSEDGIVIHYIVNFYVIAHLLFAIHELFDEYIS